MISLFSIGFLAIRLIDIMDILLVSLLLYQVYKLVRGSVAARVFIGFLLLYLIYLMARAAGMELLSTILGQFMGVGVLAAIVLFQYETRKFLSLLGGAITLGSNQLLTRFPWGKKKLKPALDITAIVEAAKALGGSNTGALIVLSNNADLKFYVESGDLINALVSKRLLLAILNKQSPLHDGGVIIYRGKIVAARCILPVTEQQSLPAQFGLRHRAALGMSEVTDTLVLAVSEETGQISVAQKGKLKHNLAAQELRTAINDYLHSH